MREKERKRGRGRKREDILRGKAVIYEQTTSNKQGEGDTPSAIKPGEGEGGEEKSQRGRQRFKEGSYSKKRGKVGGRLVPDEQEWDVPAIKPPKEEKTDQALPAIEPPIDTNLQEGIFNVETKPDLK